MSMDQFYNKDLESGKNCIFRFNLCEQRNVSGKSNGKRFERETQKLHFPKSPSLVTTNPTFRNIHSKNGFHWFPETADNLNFPQKDCL